MCCFPKSKTGCCGSTLRKTILIYSFIMIILYLFAFLCYIRNGKYIPCFMSMYALMLSLSLYAGAIKNKKSILLNIFKFGFYVNIIYCIIFYIMSFINAFRILFQEDATHINKNIDDKHNKLTSGEAKMFAIIFIILYCGDFCLEITYYLYGLYYIKLVKEEYEDAKEFRELENSL